MCSLLERWSSELDINDKSQHTIKNYYKDVEVMLEWMKERKSFANIEIEEIKQITYKDLADYMQYLKHEKKYAPSTRSRHISAIQNFYRYLVDKAELLTANENIARKLEHPKPTKNETPKFLTEEEGLMLVKALGNRDKIRNTAIVMTFLNSGLRLSELINLDLKDVVKVNDENYNIEVRNGKGNKNRKIPINGETVEAINNWLAIRPKAKTDALFLSERGKRISRTPIQRFMKRALDKIGRGDLSCHVTRHSFCSNLSNKDVDLAAIQELAGHATPQTTKIYTHVRDEKKREYVNRLNITNSESKTNANTELLKELEQEREKNKQMEAKLDLLMNMVQKLTNQNQVDI